MLHDLTVCEEMFDADLVHHYGDVIVTIQIAYLTCQLLHILLRNLQLVQILLLIGRGLDGLHNGLAEAEVHEIDLEARVLAEAIYCDDAPQGPSEAQLYVVALLDN